MTTRNLIDITNHPDLTDVTRKANIIECHNKYKSNSVVMSIEVSHYTKDGKEVKIGVQPCIAYLTADNDVKINSATGEDAVANEDGTYPAGTVGEYDFLYSLVKNNVANQLTLEEQYVVKRIDKINNKLYK